MKAWMTTIAGACALLAGMPAAAQAGTVSLYEADEGVSCCDFYSVRYTAGPGEANRVTAKVNPVTNLLTISDPGAAAITPAPGSQAAEWCTFSGTTATCRTASRYQNYYAFHLGDGDDTSQTGTPDLTIVNGGPGDDAMTHTSDTGAELFGGAGDDHLVGGTGGDQLRGGDGADVMDGRGGTDTVTYHAYNPWGTAGVEDQAPTSAVSVSLDGVADDGAAGELDNVLATNENIHGTIFDDVLLGGTGPQQLVGYQGDDQLAGGPGFDRYSCGPGADTVTADSWDRMYASLYPSQDCESGAPAL